MKNKIIIAICILIIFSSILEFKFANYSLTPIQGNWENNDQMIQIPAAYYLSNDGFFSNDLLISEYLKIYPSLLFPFVAFLYNISSSMFLTYFLLLLFLKIVFIFSVFLLSRYILKKNNLALLSTAILAFTHFMGADEIGISEVVPKNFAFAFMPLILYLFLKDRKKYSIPCFVGLGILSYFHVFSVVPIAIIFFYSYISKKEYVSFIKFLIIFSVLVIPFIFLTGLGSSQIDPDVIQVIPYANLFNGFLTIAKYIPIIIIGFILSYRKNKEIFLWLVLITFYSLLSLGGIFSEKILLATFYRSIKYVIFFSFIFSSFCVSYLFERKKIAAIGVFLILLLYFSSLYYSTVFNGITKNQSVYSSEIADVIKLSMWIDKNLEKNETLLIPPDWGAIRSWSKRPVYFSNSDFFTTGLMPLSFPNRGLYKELADYYMLKNERGIVEIAKQNKTRYIITYDMKLQLVLLFETNRFRIYSLFT